MQQQPKPYLWPNYQHELLLTASLVKGEHALSAWQQWRSAVDFTGLDFPSIQMLPLLYCNLRNQQVTDPLLDKYKSYYQHYWVKNHELFRNAGPLLTSYQTAGIETWLLKGAALSALCYKDAGLRVMADCDVMVSEEQALAAVDILLQHGWKPGFGSRQMFNKAFFSVRHSQGFKHESLNCKIDLHWRVFSQCRSRDDLSFRQNSIPLNFFGLQMRTLNLTDQLFHACVHGGGEVVGGKINWVADAMFIMAGGVDTIDWNYLAYQAKKYHLSLVMHDTLRYLHERLGGPVPPEFLQELKQIPVKKIVYNEYNYKVNPKARSFWGTLMRSWYQHSRLTGFRNALYRLITYPRYLQLIWGVSSLWRLPVDSWLIVLRRFITLRGIKKVNRGTTVD